MRRKRFGISYYATTRPFWWRAVVALFVSIIRLWDWIIHSVRITAKRFRYWKNGWYKDTDQSIFHEQMIQKLRTRLQGFDTQIFDREGGLVGYDSRMDFLRLPKTNRAVFHPRPEHALYVFVELWKAYRSLDSHHKENMQRVMQFALDNARYPLVRPEEHFFIISTVSRVLMSCERFVDVETPLSVEYFDPERAKVYDYVASLNFDPQVLGTKALVRVRKGQALEPCGRTIAYLNHLVRIHNMRIEAETFGEWRYMHLTGRRSGATEFLSGEHFGFLDGKSAQEEPFFLQKLYTLSQKLPLMDAETPVTVATLQAAGMLCEAVDIDRYKTRFQSEVQPLTFEDILGILWKRGACSGTEYAFLYSFTESIRNQKQRDPSTDPHAWLRHILPHPDVVVQELLNWDVRRSQEQRLGTHAFFGPLLQEKSKILKSRGIRYDPIIDHEIDYSASFVQDCKIFSETMIEAHGSRQLELSVQQDFLCHYAANNFIHQFLYLAPLWQYSKDPDAGGSGGDLLRFVDKPYLMPILHEHAHHAWDYPDNVVHQPYYLSAVLLQPAWYGQLTLAEEMWLLYGLLTTDEGYAFFSLLTGDRSWKRYCCHTDAYAEYRYMNAFERVFNLVYTIRAMTGSHDLEQTLPDTIYISTQGTYCVRDSIDPSVIWQGSLVPEFLEQEFSLENNLAEHYRCELLPHAEQLIAALPPCCRSGVLYLDPETARYWVKSLTGTPGGMVCPEEPGALGDPAARPHIYSNALGAFWHEDIRAPAEKIADPLIRAEIIRTAIVAGHLASPFFKHLRNSGVSARIYFDLYKKGHIHGNAMTLWGELPLIEAPKRRTRFAAALQEIEVHPRYAHGALARRLLEGGDAVAVGIFVHWMLPALERMPYAKPKDFEVCTPQELHVLKMRHDRDPGYQETAQCLDYRSAEVRAASVLPATIVARFEHYIQFHSPLLSEESYVLRGGMRGRDPHSGILIAYTMRADQILTQEEFIYNERGYEKALKEDPNDAGEYWVLHFARKFPGLGGVHDYVGKDLEQYRDHTSKSNFKALLLRYHSDKGGTSQTMQALNYIIENILLDAQASKNPENTEISTNLGMGRSLERSTDLLRHEAVRTRSQTYWNTQEAEPHPPMHHAWGVSFSFKEITEQLFVIAQSVDLEEKNFLGIGYVADRLGAVTEPFVGVQIRLGLLNKYLLWKTQILEEFRAFAHRFSSDPSAYGAECFGDLDKAHMDPNRLGALYYNTELDRYLGWIQRILEAGYKAPGWVLEAEVVVYFERLFMHFASYCREDNAAWVAARAALARWNGARAQKQREAQDLMAGAAEAYVRLWKAAWDTPDLARMIPLLQASDWMWDTIVQISEDPRVGLTEAVLLTRLGSQTDFRPVLARGQFCAHRGRVVLPPCIPEADPASAVEAVALAAIPGAVFCPTGPGASEAAGFKVLAAQPDLAETVSDIAPGSAAAVARDPHIPDIPGAVARALPRGLCAEDPDWIQRLGTRHQTVLQSYVAWFQEDTQRYVPEWVLRQLLPYGYQRSAHTGQMQDLGKVAERPPTMVVCFKPDFWRIAFPLPGDTVSPEAVSQMQHELRGMQAALRADERIHITCALPGGDPALQTAGHFRHYLRSTRILLWGGKGAVHVPEHVGFSFADQRVTLGSTKAWLHSILWDLEAWTEGQAHASTVVFALMQEWRSLFAEHYLDGVVDPWVEAADPVVGVCTGRATVLPMVVQEGLQSAVPEVRRAAEAYVALEETFADGDVPYQDVVSGMRGPSLDRSITRDARLFELGVYVPHGAHWVPDVQTRGLFEDTLRHLNQITESHAVGSYAAGTGANSVYYKLFCPGIACSDPSVAFSVGRIAEPFLPIDTDSMSWGLNVANAAGETLDGMFYVRAPSMQNRIRMQHAAEQALRQLETVSGVAGAIGVAIQAAAVARVSGGLIPIRLSQNSPFGAQYSMHTANLRALTLSGRCLSVEQKHALAHALREVRIQAFSLRGALCSETAMAVAGTAKETAATHAVIAAISGMSQIRSLDLGENPGLFHDITVLTSLLSGSEIARSQDLKQLYVDHTHMQGAALIPLLACASKLRLEKIVLSNNPNLFSAETLADDLVQFQEDLEMECTLNASSSVMRSVRSLFLEGAHSRGMIAQWSTAIQLLQLFPELQCLGLARNTLDSVPDKEQLYHYIRETPTLSDMTLPDLLTEDVVFTRMLLFRQSQSQIPYEIGSDTRVNPAIIHARRQEWRQLSERVFMRSYTEALDAIQGESDVSPGVLRHRT